MIANRQTDNAAEKPNARWYGRASVRRRSQAVGQPATGRDPLPHRDRQHHGRRAEAGAGLHCDGQRAAVRHKRSRQVRQTPLGKSGPMSSDTPHARTPWNTTACHSGEAASKKHMGTAPAESISPPTRHTFRAPMRSVSTPPSGLSTSAATVPKQHHARLKRRAAAQAFHVRGTTSVTPMKEANSRVLRRETGVESGRAEHAQIDERVVERFWRTMNAAHRAAPTARGAHT